MQARSNIAQVLAALVCAMLLAGCGGGQAAPGPGGGDEDTMAGVTGTVLVDGVPLADLDDPTVVGVQDAAKWAVRVIDPTESVDSVELPHTDTTISETGITPVANALLEIELLPAVDLSGGTSALTPVLLDIVVPLEAAVITSVNLSISFIPPLSVSAVHETAQETGYRIRLSYTARHGAKTDGALVEVDWAERRLLRDTNGNGRLDDEAYYSDSDRNGIGDNLQQGLADGNGQGPSFQDTGTVMQIDPGAATLRLGERTYLASETTVITGIDGSIITLAQIETGQRVRVTGRRGQHGAYYALSITVLSN